MKTEIIREELPRIAKKSWWLQADTEFSSGDEETLSRRLLEYYELPQKIVALFRLAQKNLGSSSAVWQELEENISDELGARTAGVAHVKILQRQLEKELGIELSSRVASTATRQFILSMKEIISYSAGFASGACYALETTAIAELVTVATLINNLAEAKRLKRPIDLAQAPEVLDDDAKINLSLFFVLHTSLIEEDHEQHLADAICNDLQDESDLAEIEDGFCRTLAVLDIWFRAII